MPSAEIDASQLSAYEAAEVEVSSSTSDGADEASGEWFVLEEPEEDHH